MDLPPPRAPRVLLVEDDLALAYALEHELLKLGAEVLVAGDGRSALRQLTDEILTLDLLVTDLEAPALDGLGLVQLLRTTCGETELAILVIADHVSGETLAKFQAQGVGVLGKDDGLPAIAEEARRLLEYMGRLARPRAPALTDEPWVPEPLPRRFT
jgi:CheY-like chemotaxis protein